MPEDALVAMVLECLRDQMPQDKAERDKEVALMQDYFADVLSDNKQKDAKRVLATRIGRSMYPESPYRLGTQLTTKRASVLLPMYANLINMCFQETGVKDDKEFKANLTQSERVAAMEMTRMICGVQEAVSDDGNLWGLSTGVIMEVYSVLINMVKYYKAAYHKTQTKLDKANKKLDDAKSESKSSKPTSESKQVQALQKELRQAREQASKDIAAATREVRTTYQKQVEECQREIDGLHSRLDAAIRELQKNNLDISHDVDMPEIPEQGVIVCGGHPNFINKLKALYPNWSYDPRGTVPTAKYKVVIHEHASHGDSLQVDRWNPGLKTIYVKSTNLSNALSEIQMGLLKYQECDNSD